MYVVSAINMIYLFIIVVTGTHNTYMSKQTDSSCKDRIPRVCDYIIVGAGAAGAVVASRLSEDPKVVVCLFEAGTKDTDQPMTPAVETPRLWTSLFAGDFTWNYITVPQTGLNGREPFAGMGKGYGGSTSHHAMSYFRGFKADFDYWASKGVAGWRYEDVLPFFLKLENPSPFQKDSEMHNRCGPLTISPNFELVNSPLFKLLSKTARENRIKTVGCLEPSPFGICLIPSTIKSGKRESSSTAYLQPFIGRKNFFIFPETFVEKILIKRKRAYGIQFQGKGRRSFITARREIIVSGGSLDSPKLLQRSGIGPKHLLRKLQIRPHAFLPVGENYHDHVVFILDLSLDIETITLKSIMEPMVLSEYIFRRKGLYAEATGTHAMFIDTIRQKYNWPEFQLIFTDGKNREAVTGEDIKSGKFLNRKEENRNGTTILLLLSHPKSRGTVQLRSLNAIDPPLIDPKLLQYKEDLTQMIKGIRRIQHFVQSPSMRKVGAALEPRNEVPKACKNLKTDSDRQWECILRNLAGPAFHPISTCKMGSSRDPSAVVDPKLRVKGIKGLRVADASIIPVISVNTQGPTIMIGERAADFIRKQYNRY